jgi:putative membrane protein
MRRSILLILTASTTLGLACAAHAQDDKARHFLRDALQGDNSEMMLGKMAAEQGSDPRLKRYGEMLAMDHTMHREKVMKVGSAMNLPDDHEPMPEAAKERDKLRGMHGRDFDREFARYMVKDHRQDIGDYRKAAKLRGEPGRLARDTLPTLQKHLSVAEKLAG